MSDPDLLADFSKTPLGQAATRVGGIVSGVNITMYPATVERVLNRRELCALGQHRPAYLNAGGVACGYCGVPL